MFLFSLIKLILIFPFVLYIVVKLYTKNKRLSYLIVAPIYLVSLVLWLRYLIGSILSLIITCSLFVLLTYITIQMKKPIKLDNAKLVRYTLILFSRMYFSIYIILFLLGILQEFFK